MFSNYSYATKRIRNLSAESEFLKLESIKIMMNSNDISCKTRSRA